MFVILNPFNVILLEGVVVGIVGGGAVVGLLHLNHTLHILQFFFYVFLKYFKTNMFLHPSQRATNARTLQKYKVCHAQNIYKFEYTLFLIKRKLKI